MNSSRISEIRKRKGLTQAELAARSGVTPANLCKIERGQQDPTVSTLIRICEGLGVSPAEIFQEPPAQKPLRWTRRALERVARAVVGDSEKLSKGEGEIVELLKDTLPGYRPGRLSSRRVYESWYELKQRLSGEEIKTLAQRVQDVEQRREAEWEEDYQKLVVRLRKLLGRK